MKPVSTVTTLPSSAANTQVSNPPAATPITLDIPPSPTHAITHANNRDIGNKLTSLDTLFEDKNAGFVYSSGWRNETNNKAYKRSYMIFNFIHHPEIDLSG